MHQSPTTHHAAPGPRCRDAAWRAAHKGSHPTVSGGGGFTRMSMQSPPSTRSFTGIARSCPSLVQRVWSLHFDPEDRRNAIKQRGDRFSIVLPVAPKEYGQNGERVEARSHFVIRNGGHRAL